MEKEKASPGVFYAQEGENFIVPMFVFPNLLGLINCLLAQQTEPIPEHYKIYYNILSHICGGDEI